MLFSLWQRKQDTSFADPQEAKETRGRKRGEERMHEKIEDIDAAKRLNSKLEFGFGSDGRYG
jgi:hypothetical protein